jgi:hypothetical protein
MKKLLVLSALLGLLVLPVFADHVSIDMGGDLTFGFMGDFGDNEAEKVDFTWDVMVGIDDYNSFTWSLANVGTGNALDKALVTSDVGMWLGLPVGLMINWGYDDPDANEFQVVSGYGNEEIFNLSPDEYWGLDFLLTYNIVEVEVAFNPGVSGAAGDFGYLLAGLALKEPVPGLNAEVYWYQGGSFSEAAGADGILGTGDDGVYTLTDDFSMGQIAFDAAYSTEVAGIGLDVGAAFFYDMDDQATNAWIYGIGLAAAVNMFDITVGLDGNETDALNGVTATVDIAPVDMASLYAGLELSLADGADAFQGADIGVNAHIGLVEAYLGYLITSVAAGEYNSDFGPLTDGGMYVKFDVDY